MRVYVKVRTQVALALVVLAIVLCLLLQALAGVWLGVK